MRVLIAVAVLLAAGCASAKEDVTALRLAMEKMDEALELQAEVNAANVKALGDELLARAFGEIYQAVLDDLRRLEQSGTLKREEVADLYAKAEGLKKAAAEAVAAWVAKAADPTVSKELREIYGALRAYLDARLTQDELVAELIAEALSLAGRK